jgi:hypothetical protein
MNATFMTSVIGGAPGVMRLGYCAHNFSNILASYLAGVKSSYVASPRPSDDPSASAHAAFG